MNETELKTKLKEKIDSKQVFYNIVDKKRRVETANCKKFQRSINFKYITSLDKIIENVADYFVCVQHDQILSIIRDNSVNISYDEITEDNILQVITDINDKLNSMNLNNNRFIVISKNILNSFLKRVHVEMKVDNCCLCSLLNYDIYVSSHIKDFIIAGSKDTITMNEFFDVDTIDDDYVCTYLVDVEAREKDKILVAMCNKSSHILNTTK